jgi:hypothetical protein
MTPLPASIIPALQARLLNEAAVLFLFSLGKEWREKEIPVRL